jgi:DNA-binding transcriptional ArsR family regulator
MDREREEQLYRLQADLCRVLAEPTRLKLLSLLGERPRAVKELVKATGERQAKISQHLTIMRKLGIVRTQRVGTEVKQGRDEEPSAAIIDSQSIKTSAVRGPEKGYDMGKKSMGRHSPRARGKASQSAGCQGDRSPEIRSSLEAEPCWRR